MSLLRSIRRLIQGSRAAVLAPAAALHEPPYTPPAPMPRAPRPLHLVAVEVVYCFEHGRHVRVFCKACDFGGGWENIRCALTDLEQRSDVEHAVAGRDMGRRAPS